MDIELAEEYLRALFTTKNIHALRAIARKAGVPASTTLLKEEIVERLTALYVGRAVPVFTKKGAPAKEADVDPKIYDQISEILRVCNEEPKWINSLEVHSNTYDEHVAQNIYERPLYKGILEILQVGYGFVRTKNCQPNNSKDVYISAPAIHNYRLREGDLITCIAKTITQNGLSSSPEIELLGGVNGLPVGMYEKRPFFEDLTALYAKEKIELSAGDNDPALRLIDLFAPIGKGQRALIVAPPQAGKTTLLKSIARSISENHRDLKLIVLLIDVRPEEVTDFKASIPDDEVIYSTFDDGEVQHVRAAKLTIEHAKRFAEQGKDVVVLLDSLTKLTRAHNLLAENTGKTPSDGLDLGAFAEAKRFFSAARNTEEAGSITILATAPVDTGSRMDDIIYEGFKGTANSDIFLSRDLTQRRIFPAIDIRRSGTRKEEMLLSEEELKAVYKLREKGFTENTEGLIEMLGRTESNREFIARLPEWMKDI